MSAFATQGGHKESAVGKGRREEETAVDAAQGQKVTYWQYC